MYRRTGATPPRNPTLRKITVSIGTSTPWSADRADDRARPGDRERRRHRLTGTHALQSAVDTDPTGELQDRLHRGVAALGDDICRPERSCHLLPRWVPAERDDAGSAEPTSCDHRTKPHRAIPNDGDDGARANAAAHCRVMACAHHIGEGEQRAQRRVGVTRARDRQWAHVPSLYVNGAMTRSAFSMPATSAPTFSTTPMNSWPIGPSACGDSPR